MVIDTIKTKLANYKQYKTKTLLGLFIQTFIFNKAFAILVSTLVTIITGITLGLLDVDYNTIAITAIILLIPAIVWIVVGFAYCFFILPAKWIIRKFKK